MGLPLRGARGARGLLFWLARPREVPARGPDAARAAGARGPAARRRRVPPGGAPRDVRGAAPDSGRRGRRDQAARRGRRGADITHYIRRGRVSGRGVPLRRPGGPRGAQGSLAPRAGRPPRVPAAHAHERLRRRRRRRADGVLVPAVVERGAATKRGRLGGLRRGALAAASAGETAPVVAENDLFAARESRRGLNLGICSGHGLRAVVRRNVFPGMTSAPFSTDAYFGTCSQKAASAWAQQSSSSNFCLSGSVPQRNCMYLSVPRSNGYVDVACSTDTNPAPSTRDRNS